MCYWFERQGEYIRCEVRQVAGQYEFTVATPDGGETVERFDDSALLHVRQRILEHRFTKGGWRGPHGRTI
jgi:hypothetical protein